MPKQEAQGAQKNAPKKGGGAGANKPKQGGDNKPKQGGDNKPKQGGDNKPKQGGDNKPKQGGDNKPKQQNVGGEKQKKQQQPQQQSGGNNNQQKKQTNEKNQPKKQTGDKNQPKQQPQAAAGGNNNQQKKQQPQQQQKKQGAKDNNQQKKPTADNKQKPAGSQNVKKQQKVNRPKVSDQQKDTKGGKGKNVKPTQPIKKKLPAKQPAKPVKATKDIKIKGKGDKFDNKARIDLILRRKYQNPNKPTPTQLETQICQYLVDLEASSKDLKPHLRDLGIVAAREIAITNTKSAIVVFIPYTQQEKWKKIQEKVIRELGKKFNGQDVLFVVQRKVMKLNQIKNNYPRPRNQTITSVHNSILEDLVYPTRIVGKRIRFRVGGKRILKVYLDPKDTKDLESKLLTFSKVYRKLTNKLVLFMFPRYVI